MTEPHKPKYLNPSERTMTDRIVRYWNMVIAKQIANSTTQGNVGLEELPGNPEARWHKEWGRIID